MFTIPVRKVALADGEGLEHWTHDAPSDRASRVIHAACDGKKWTLYEPGDKLPGEPGAVAEAAAAAGIDVDKLVADKVAAAVAAAVTAALAAKS